MKCYPRNLLLIAIVLSIIAYQSIIILQKDQKIHSQKIQIAKAKENIRLLDDAVKLIGVGGEGEISNYSQILLNRKGADQKYDWRFPDLEFPLKKDTTYITSEFNDIRYNAKYDYKFKIKSVDLKCIDDLRIKASISGVCHIMYNKDYGNQVVITNENGEQCYYGHLERIDVGEDQLVDKGQVIGIIGNTGHCMIYDYRQEKWREITEEERLQGFGKHLDFEYRVNGIPQNVFSNSILGNDVL
jgi:murein DD-endopeptidase MepM/ murein hydrolase activator NlpD